MAASSIPLIEPSQEIDAIRDEVMAAIERVIASGRFIMGPEVESFEKEAAEHIGVKHAIGVNSCTDAIVIGLRALGVSPEDEVITTAFSFFATAEGITAMGAKPVFVDIDPNTFNIDPALVEEAITPKTRAIIPVHLFGQSADMTPLVSLAKMHGLKILEDAAQSFGAEYDGRKVGSIGDIGAFSFFPTKNLATLGDGGLVATNDDEVAATARMLRVHGAKKKYFNEVAGYNSRLDSLHAAILRVKLPRIDARNDMRRKAADEYRRLLADIKGVVLPHEAPYGRHAYNQFTLRILDGKRDELKAALAEAGVSTMIYYPVPQHKLPIYADQDWSCPESEKAADEVLSLPFWPEMSPETQEQVAKHLSECLS